MRKKIIQIIIIFLVICAVWWIMSFIFSYNKITFTLQNTDYTLQIRTASGKKIKDIESSGEITLREGNYFYNVIGEGYDGKSISFSVKDSTEMTIHPEYLESYLLQLGEREQQSAMKVLSNTYPTVGTITIDSFNLDKTAQWGYGKLHLDNVTTDMYRFILKKDDDTWKIHIKPQIVISKEQAKDVPEEILYSLY